MERVVAEIRALHAAGELATTNVLMERGHRDLVSAANRYTKGWAHALALAGVAQYSRRGPKWTRRRVLDEIRARDARGESLMQTDAPNALKIAAQRLFGGWRAARAMAVPDFAEPYQRWTNRKVLTTILEIHARGAPLTTDAARANAIGGLVNAAVRAFGTWEAAVRAAVPGYEGRRTWTPQAVKAALRRRQRAAASLNAADVSAEDPSLLNAARKHFGRWRHALEAAGVPTTERREAWGPDLVKARLRAVVNRHARISARLAGSSLVAAAQRHFGSFRAACVAAAVIP